MTLDQIRIALTEPGKLFDAGYDDCLEGRTPRFDDEKYLRGYKLAKQMREIKNGKQADLGSGRKD
jgi:hypothetical protein